jgi:hypothetical protein
MTPVQERKPIPSRESLSFPRHCHVEVIDREEQIKLIGDSYHGEYADCTEE